MNAMNARNIERLPFLPVPYHAASGVRRKLLAAVAHRLTLTTLLALLMTWTDGAARAEEYQLFTIAGDLRWPWSVARLPDDSFLITEREGRLIHLDVRGNRQVVKGAPATLFAGQGGFFDIALHPDFSTNRLIYLSYAEGSPQANRTAIYRARLIDDRLESGRQILRVSPDKNTPQHYGGRMLFLKDNTLLLTTGEGFEHREEAQSRDSELGKVLRIDDSGNPAGMNSALDGKLTRIFSLGHRNPQGLSADPQTGAIYLHEHGPRGGDELNRLDQGKNYGWPAVTHGVDYSGAYVSPFKRAPAMVDPLWTWVPSIAPSGMAWYNGHAFPEWRSSLLIGALVDKEVRRLQIHDGKVVKEEVLFGELESRIRDVRVFGEDLFLLTDSEQGSLIQVLPR
jgi:glucose/arabinose dehydrogenase